jgi:hypothetical protein
MRRRIHAYEEENIPPLFSLACRCLKRGDRERVRGRVRKRELVCLTNLRIFFVWYSRIFFFEQLSSTWAVHRSRCWALGTKK